MYSYTHMSTHSHFGMTLKCSSHSAAKKGTAYVSLCVCVSVCSHYDLCKCILWFCCLFPGLVSTSDEDAVQRPAQASDGEVSWGGGAGLRWCGQVCTHIVTVFVIATVSIRADCFCCVCVLRSWYLYWAWWHGCNPLFKFHVEVWLGLSSSDESDSLEGTVTAGIDRPVCFCVCVLDVDSDGCV